MTGPRLSALTTPAEMGLEVRRARVTDGTVPTVVDEEGADEDNGSSEDSAGCSGRGVSAIEVDEATSAGDGSGFRTSDADRGED